MLNELVAHVHKDGTVHSHLMWKLGSEITALWKDIHDAVRETRIDEFINNSNGSSCIMNHLVAIDCIISEFKAISVANTMQVITQEQVSTLNNDRSIGTTILVIGNHALINSNNKTIGNVTAGNGGTGGRGYVGGNGGVGGGIGIQI